MSSTPIVIPSTPIDEDDLQQWVADTEKLTGSRITVDRQWLVHSENESVNQALAALFGNPTTEQAARKPRKARAEKPEKPKIKLNTAPPGELRAWRVLGEDGEPVESLSLAERNHRLSGGAFAEGTILHHPKAGKHRVTGAPGVGQGQGMEPVE